LIGQTVAEVALLNSGDYDMDMEKLLYNVNEVAGLLNISRAMIYVLIKEEKIKTVHIGRSMRIHIDEVRSFVDSLSKVS
jgi:hypothetical protein